jgi:hypothetical protein
MVRAFNELTDENFELYAVRYYSNPQCMDVKEFHDDMLRFKYIRKLFKRYADSGQLQERLIMNHIIILNNVFPTVVANRLLFYKLGTEFWPALKTFLLFLNRIAIGTYEDIPIDPVVAQRLKSI